LVGSSKPNLKKERQKETLRGLTPQNNPAAANSPATQEQPRNDGQRSTGLRESNASATILFFHTNLVHVLRFNNVEETEIWVGVQLRDWLKEFGCAVQTSDFFNLIVFIKDQPEQVEQETKRSKDTKFD